MSYHKAGVSAPGPAPSARLRAGVASGPSEPRALTSSRPQRPLQPHSHGDRAQPSPPESLSPRRHADTAKPKQQASRPKIRSPSLRATCRLDPWPPEAQRAVDATWLTHADTCVTRGQRRCSCRTTRWPTTCHHREGLSQRPGPGRQDAGPSGWPRAAALLPRGHLALQGRGLLGKAPSTPAPLPALTVTGNEGLSTGSRGPRPPGARAYRPGGDAQPGHADRPQRVRTRRPPSH